MSGFSGLDFDVSRALLDSASRACAAASSGLCRDGYVLVLNVNGEPDGTRANFERDVHNRVTWFRNHGRFNEPLS